MSNLPVSARGARAAIQAVFATLSKVTDSLFTPPFKGGIVVAWLALVFSTTRGKGTIWDGYLHDPDNYLYLVQAMDLLKGQSWFDHIQHRMNPPEGTYIHYSNYLAVVYSALIYALRPIFGSLGAAFATAALIPPLFFLGFLLVLRRLAQIFVDKEWGDAVGYLVILSPLIMIRFFIGHIDHHGIVALFIAVAYGGMLYLCLRPNAAKIAALAGLSVSLSLVLALETVSFVVLFSLCLAGMAIIRGGDVARSCFIFGLSLFVCSALLLLGVRSFENLFVVDLLAYSIVYVILTASIALCFSGVALFRKSTVSVRFPVGVFLGILTGGAYLYFFPALVDGPYGGMNPEVKKIIFSVASEAWPIFTGKIHAQIIGNVLWDVIALTANWIMFVRAGSKEFRWAWGINLVVLAAAVLLSVFYQIRFSIYVHTFAVLPLTGLVKLMWERSSAMRARSTFWLILLSFPIILFFSGSSHIDHELARAMDEFKPASSGCDMQVLATVLGDKLGYGQSPRLIINTMNEGSELLLRTPHRVLSAPYHMNVSGNLDAHRFFTTRDPEEAKTIALRRQADLVVVCRNPPQLKQYRPLGYAKAGDGRIFVDRLIDNEVPGWLKPIQPGRFGDLLLFEIALPKGET